MKYRKKPVVIEAMLFDGTNFDEIFAWATTPDLSVLNAKVLLDGGGKDPTKLVVETLEGNVGATIGDYIIKGVKGEFYPCRADIFALTYEPVEEDTTNGR